MRNVRVLMFAAIAALVLPTLAAAQQPPAQQPPAQPPSAPPAPPPFQTTKVNGTDNVYVFRYGFVQSMFVVTPEGVIATNPISLHNPEVAKTYIGEIRKVTDKPIKYLIYSHSHFDHISGGKAFKDAGATIIAHKNAKEHLDALKKANVLPDEVIMPDQTVGDRQVVTLGGTTLELLYVGRNYTDDMLIFRLPKEKIVFVVDFIPIDSVLFRTMNGSISPLEWEDSVKRVLALDWDQMIPGHPYGRIGTKADAQAVLAYMQDLSAEVKKYADAGKCWDTAEKEIKLPKYEKWFGYQTWLPMNIERYCSWWRNGE